MGAVGSGEPLRDDEACAAIALAAVRGFGPARIRELVDALGSARDVLAAAATPRAVLADRRLSGVAGSKRSEDLLRSRRG